MSGGRRGGERRRHAPQSVCTWYAQSCASHDDASFARSFDPCTSILTTHPGASRGGGATVRHHGWANPRKREEPTLGSRRTDVARLAACHRFRKGEGVARKKRKGIAVPVPARIKSSGQVARTLQLLQKSVGDVGSRISSANALQKGRSGPSERGPSSERKSAGETVGGRVERNVRRESDSPPRRERIGARLRVTRDRHPAVHPSPKAVCGSRDRGCKGHRILRRVPVDGRYPGSHERRPSRDGESGGLGGLHIFQPVRTNQKKDVRPACSSCEGGRSAKMKRELATGVPEARSHQRRGKKTPTLVIPPWVARPGARDQRVDDDPPKRSRMA
jgi:hypothetical protein